MESHLRGYNLPTEALWDIKRIVEKRYKTRYWEELSPEGRAAMQEVIEDDNLNSCSRHKNDVTTTKTTEKSKSKTKGTHDLRRKRTISFTDKFNKSSSGRLDGDITDVNFKAENMKKRAIGGKIESALETIEIVKHGEDKTADDSAIAETAKLNSVEKCLVWMEVNDDVTDVVGRSSTPRW